MWVGAPGRQNRHCIDRLPNERVERVGEGIVVAFDSDILFAVNQATLQPAGQQDLRDLVASLIFASEEMQSEMLRQHGR